MRHGLFGKRVVTVEGVSLRDADLSRVAATVADALGVPAAQVWVTAAGGDRLEFDVMAPSVVLDAWQGSESPLLDVLGGIPGVGLAPGARVTGEGILGTISWPGDAAGDPAATGAAVRRIQAERRRRAAVFATGDEIADGLVRDRNSPYLAGVLERAGLRVELGGVLRDEPARLVAGIEQALSRGAGWVVTTGGVGGGPGDHTVSAVRRLDPDVACAPVATFHHAHGPVAVEVCVGAVEGAFVVCLPGPHDEVVACAPALTATVRSPSPVRQRAAADLAAAVAHRSAKRRAVTGGGS